MAWRLARAAGRLGARALLLVAVGLTGIGGSARAQEPAGFGRFAGVRVDVGPMLAMGAGAQAQALREDLLAALRRALADRIGGRGPSLVVRVHALSLNPYAGSQGGGRGGRGGGLQNDYLDGEAVLVGPGGEVIARHPQLSALPSSSGGAWYDPLSERRRVTAIAEHYAQWLGRTLPAH